MVNQKKKKQAFYVTKEMTYVSLSNNDVVAAQILFSTQRVQNRFFTLWENLCGNTLTCVYI